jgi:DNA-binding MarR family transcriptional regulator
MMESNRTGTERPDPDPVKVAVTAFRDLATNLDLLDQVAATRLGIARSDLRCLDVLTRQGTLSAGALARAVGLSAPALSAALRRLETLNYIRREHDDRDRRTVRITLTESAVTTTGSLFSLVHNATITILADLSPAELSTITRVSNALADVIQNIASTEVPVAGLMPQTAPGAPRGPARSAAGTRCRPRPAPWRSGRLSPPSRHLLPRTLPHFHLVQAPGGGRTVRPPAAQFPGAAAPASVASDNAGEKGEPTWERS